MNDGPADGREPGFHVLGRQRIHDGFVKLESYTVRQETFSGGISPPLQREIVIVKSAVAVICYDPDREIVVLVEQLRIPAALAGFPAIQTEIVAGLIEPGESPEEVGYREVREETGLETLGTLMPIASFLTTPGHSTESVHLFCGRVDSTKVGKLGGLAAENEDIRVLPIRLSEFDAWLHGGRITNGFTLIAGLWLRLNRAAVRRAWNMEG